jgi:signal transduction histidine kinase
MKPDDAAGGLLEALRRSEERYRAYLRHTSQAIWRFELDAPIPTSLPIDEQIARAFRDGWLAECNDAMARMYGYETAAEIVGARLKDLLIQEDENNIAYLRAFVESGYRLEDMETHERDRTGADKYFVNSLVGIIEDGMLVRAWGTQRDISDKRVADRRRETGQQEMVAALERAARRSAFLARAGALLSSTLDVKHTLTQVATLAVPHIADWCAVHLVGPDGTIEQIVAAHVNPEKVQWAESLRKRYPPDQTTGISQVIRTGEPQIITSLSDAMIEATAKDAEHLRILRELAVRSVIMVPMTARGRTIGAVTLISTSESDRAFDDEDMTLAQQLASRAALAAENARLYEEAQEANRLKDEFFATLSHELRTPINAVLGWAQMLQDGVLDEAGTARALQAIARNARTQAELLGDILEMSRIVSGKIDLTMEDVDLSALAAEVIESLRPTFNGKRQVIVESLAPGLTVRADRARLQQVVFNLLSNAAKFTPAGGRIEIEAAQRDRQVELRVRDTGAGISAEFLPYVFERFRQADSSSTRVHGGLGIVELHGGTITAASAGPGQGATFTVRFPAPPEAA